MKNTHIKFIGSCFLFLFLLFGSSYAYHRNGIETSIDEHAPSHEPFDSDCQWTKRVFPISGIALFEQTCEIIYPYTPLPTYIEDEQGRIIQRKINLTNPEVKNDIVAMEIMTKNSDESPMEVIRKNWFNKLTTVQQSSCSIQDADVPISRFDDGRPIGIEAPHTTPHKVRYKIAIKPEIIDSILKKNGGFPQDISSYDYLCGKVVGSLFLSSTPYFEFDDRNPNKYLFVHLSWNDQGPNIDLNTIRF